MRLRRLGRLPWTDALALQRQARDRVLAGGEDELYLVEHDPIVTLGRRGGEVDPDALARLSTPIVQADRGGQATWHGPGQLVAYPVVDLQRRRLGVPEMVALLGHAMVEACAALGAPAVAYDPDRPGVYLDGAKLGSIGLHVHRNVTSHGLALNVCCDLAGFAAITPCGYRGLPITTLALATGRPLTVDQAQDALLAALAGRGLAAQ